MSSRYEIWGMDKSVDTAARHLIVSNTSDPLNGHIIPAKRLHRIFWNLLEHSRMLYVPNFQNIPDYSRTSSNIPCSNVPESRMLSNVLGHYFGTEGSVSNSVLAVRYRFRFCYRFQYRFVSSPATAAFFIHSQFYPTLPRWLC